MLFDLNDSYVFHRPFVDLSSVLVEVYQEICSNRRFNPFPDIFGLIYVQAAVTDHLLERKHAAGKPFHGGGLLRSIIIHPSARFYKCEGESFLSFFPVFFRKPRKFNLRLVQSENGNINIIDPWLYACYLSDAFAPIYDFQRQVSAFYGKEPGIMPVMKTVEN